jgi:hypothetical protein
MHRFASPCSYAGSRAWACALGLLACGRTEPLRDAFADGDGGWSQGSTALGEPPPGCALEAFETHTLAPLRRRPIDVLFVIDDSGSMGNDQQALGRNFGSFISSFRASQVDFHLGAITTDMTSGLRRGKLVAPFLTAATPDLEQAFLRMVTVGSSGSSREQAIAAAAAALSEPLTSGGNRGFLRAEADLALVFLGDEDDQSPVAVDSLVGQLRALKVSQTVTVASIIGLGGCWIPSLVSGWRLAQVARAFGATGVLVLCRDDYSDILRTIAGRVVNGRCVVGLKHPLDSRRRIRVAVNGGTTTWYSAEPDAAYPFGSIEVVPCPERGGTVELAYDACWR